MDVCKTCGETLEDDQECPCQQKCDHCDAQPGTRCQCRPSKRPRLASEMSGDTLQYPTRPVLAVDPTGRGWIDKVVDRDAPLPPDTCDMYLTKNISSVRQLFNNYGKFNNRQLLSVYGFIDPNCQTDTVCLRHELFDYDKSYIQIDPERREYWKTEGYDKVIELSKYWPDQEWEMEILLERNDCPTTGDEFVNWSLTLGQHGWVRFPLKIWGILVLFSKDEWETFKVNTVSILPKIKMFEVPRIPDDELIFFEKWLTLLYHAVETRYAKYQDAADHQQWMLAHRKYNSYDPDEVINPALDGN